MTMVPDNQSYLCPLTAYHLYLVLLLTAYHNYCIWSVSFYLKHARICNWINQMITVSLSKYELTGKVQVTNLVIATTNIKWMSYWDSTSNLNMGLYEELYFHYSWPLARLHVWALITNWKDWNSPWYNNISHLAWNYQ